MTTQRLSLLTIGVHNLELMRNFYVNQFGWTPMPEEGDIVFFKLNGSILSLYPYQLLAEDIGIDHQGSGFKQFTTALLLNSEAEVDDLFSQLAAKNVTIIKQPQKVFWGGYSGYIADPENNYWEIAFNPFIQLDEAGNIL
jgi:uncharacterized protein